MSKQYTSVEGQDLVLISIEDIVIIKVQSRRNVRADFKSDIIVV